MRTLVLTLIAFMLIGCAVDTASDTPDSAPGESQSTDSDLPLHLIDLPPGFSIDVYAEDVPNARAMALTPGGTLFVGSRRAGNVYAVVDTDNDHRADRVYTIDRGLHMPSGLAFHNGSLYVGAVSRILRYDDIESRLENPPEPVVVYDDLPSDESHGWKYIAFGPDGDLYVPVGAPCNICDPEPPYASLLRMNPDGSDVELFARGIRNTVGFDWHPETGVLWFTDNGRDWLGDNRPPDELNRAPEAGLHFGYPYVHGGNILDPEFGEGHDPDDYVAPAQNLGPHVAALGMAFYTGDMFPEEYRHDIFIAEHGSWNRSEKIGYRVMRVRLDAQHNAVAYEPFATGWLQGDAVWGRPVDVEVMPDGSLLVSDDEAGAIYRITYEG